MGNGRRSFCANAGRFGNFLGPQTDRDQNRRPQYFTKVIANFSEGQSQSCKIGFLSKLGRPSTLHFEKLPFSSASFIRGLFGALAGFKFFISYR